MQTRPSAVVAEKGRPSASAASGRLNYVDWLRALALLGVFFYHSLRPFTSDAWHVTSTHPSAAIDALIGFVDPWGIAFFFMIAGASAFLALGRRTPAAFVRERLLRLLLPLVVAYLLLSPIQAYIEQSHLGHATGSLLGWFPSFFSEVASKLPTTIKHPLLVDRSYHLWFVIFLLWYVFLGLPPSLWLRDQRGERFSTWLGGRASRRGSMLLLAVPISVLPLAVLPLWPESEDWGTFAYLFGFYLAGAVLMSDPRLMEAVRRDVVLALTVALAIDATILLIGVPAFIDRWGSDPSYSPMYLFAYFAVTVQAWAWVLSFLGLGARAKRFRQPLSPTVSEAAMPFFIVHQPVILAVAFVVVRRGMPMAAEWAVIVTTSFSISAALAFALARVPLASAMFGVKKQAGTSEVDRARTSRPG